jgi:hypothetical protein
MVKKMEKEIKIELINDPVAPVEVDDRTREL